MKRTTLKSLQKELQYYLDTERFFRNATGSKNDLANADQYKQYAVEKQKEIDNFKPQPLC